MSSQFRFRKGEMPQPAVIGLSSCPSAKTLNLQPLIENCRKTCSFKRLLKEKRDERKNERPSDSAKDFALINAVKRMDHSKAEQLIKEGADVNSKTQNEETPIDFACRNGDLLMFKILKNHGAK
ncbi:ankyrin repeat domain-containing protein [Candidatus Micrarchaeota archaeon]|nr:ankyrin repeat domain-containing protein [Candidatus Micrarchaeota archaeon]